MRGKGVYLSLSLTLSNTHTHGVCEQDSHTLTARLRSQYTEVCSEREREREEEKTRGREQPLVASRHSSSRRAQTA